MVTAAVLFVLTITKHMLGISAVPLPSLVELSRGIHIMDRYNKPVCVVQKDEARQVVPLARISPNVRTALLAAEDRNFFSHHGLDPVGIGRALVKNWQAGKVLEGGSTITQQLVRQLYLDASDRSLTRKLKEAFMSWEVENYYSKEKILETYLNKIYFGNGAFGIEQAAWNYFNKPSSRLTLAEAAYIAGVVRAPSDLGSPSNRDRGLARQKEILAKVKEYKLAGAAEVEKARQQKLVFKAGPHAWKHPYYVAYVLDKLDDEFGSRMWEQGMKVYTNLDPKAQQEAEKSITAGIKTAPRGVNQGALVSINVEDSAVLAIVGGAGDFRKHQWNRAIYPHTAGSAFKPFVYLSALVHGVLDQDSLLSDSPLVIGNPYGLEPYAPRNFDNRYYGLMTVRQALALSRNVPAVRVIQQTGPQNVVATARALGISTKMDPYLSLALGSCAVSPLEMANAYAAIARSGAYMPPQVIRKVETEDGRVLKTYQQSGRNVLPAEPCRQLVDLLEDVVRRGTGTQARLPGIHVAGKTGTADQARDIWFIGFTADTVTAVWGGNDKNQAVNGNHVTGGTVMAKIWREYMKKFYTTHPQPQLAFAPPDEPLRHDLPPPPPVFLADVGDFVREVGQVFHEIEPAPDYRQAVPSDNEHGSERKSKPFRVVRKVLSGLLDIF